MPVVSRLILEYPEVKVDKFISLNVRRACHLAFLYVLHLTWLTNASALNYM